MITMYVFGAGGFGREVMPLAMVTHRKCRFLIDQPEENLPLGIVNGTPLRTIKDFFDDYDDPDYVIAVGDPRARYAIAARLEANERARAALVVSRLANIMPPNLIGGGTIICGFASVHPNASIGKHCHLNIYSYAAHDCTIGNFVTLAPKAAINGNCKIGDGAYIGSGAVLREGISIGAGAVVGMGAVVVKDVPPGVTVVGNPAITHRERQPVPGAPFN